MTGPALRSFKSAKNQKKINSEAENSSTGSRKAGCNRTAVRGFVILGVRVSALRASIHREHPEGCKEISRWSASEASVTTGNVISELLASRLGCKGFEPIPGVAPLRGLTPG